MPKTPQPKKAKTMQASIDETEIMHATSKGRLSSALPKNFQSYNDDYLFWHKAQQTRKDTQVMACMQQRIYNAIALDYAVHAVDETPQARETADFVWKNLRKINIDRVTEQMLWSRYYGFAVAEILWEKVKGCIMIAAIKPCHPQHFSFDEKNRLCMKNAHGKQAVLPEKKFWHVASGGICSNDMMGEPLCDWLYAPVKMKRECVEQWQLFLEKYASPTVVGKYPAARIRESEKQALLEAAANIRRDTAAVIPDSMVLELLEARRTGNGEYHPLAEYADRSIAKLILGQTLTTEQGSSYAQANVHDRVRSRLVQADCDLVSESFTKQVVTWLCEWNFGKDAPVPIFCRGHQASSQEA